MKLPTLLQSISFGLDMTYILVDERGYIIEYDPTSAINVIAMAVGQEFLDVLPEFFGQEDLLEEVRRGERKFLRFENINRVTSSGEIRYLRLIVVPAKGNLLVLLVDMTELSVHMQELTQVRNELRLTERCLNITNQQLQTLNQRLQDDLAIAWKIQQSLLLPPQPQKFDLDVVCYSVPARQVGGDFYSYHAFSDFGLGILDFGLEEQSKTQNQIFTPPKSGERKEGFQNPKSKIQNQRYAFAVGDVSGKGVSAALLMAACQSQLDASFSQPFTPKERMIYLDKVIEPYTKSCRQNCAMSYVELEIRGQDFGLGILDFGLKDEEISLSQNTLWGTSGGNPKSKIQNPKSPLLHIINAACIPPYIRHRNGQVEQPEIGGFALGQGLGAMVGYQQHTLELSSGDVIILTSDGVVEANNGKGDMLGFERLEQIISRGPITDAAAMLEHIKAQVQLFTEGEEQHDDMTIVVVLI